MDTIKIFKGDKTMPNINKIKKNTETNADIKLEQKVETINEIIKEPKMNKDKFFYIDLGSFTLEINAMMYIDRLYALGLHGLSYKGFIEDGEMIYHIYSQPFNTIDDAKTYKTEMIKLGFIDSFIKEV